MTRYDELPYDSLVHPVTDPEHLEMASWAHGGPLPREKAVSVLELGCGDGTNLNAMAKERPSCAFLGVDLSDTHIARARERAAANTRFEVGDVARFASSRRHDYILAHGIFSWVGDDAREAILEIASRHLEERGLFLLSYNTLPGWALRGRVREQMRRSGLASLPIGEQAQALRAWAGSRLALLPPQEHPYAGLLRQELARVQGRSDAYLVHEYLEEQNEAFWFRDVAARAERHGLAYVGDAMFNRDEGRIGQALLDSLMALGLDRGGVEETFDFLAYRQFRASIFCRAGAPRMPALTPTDLGSLFVRARTETAPAGLEGVWPRIRASRAKCDAALGPTLYNLYIDGFVDLFRTEGPA